eukprot:4403727-Amphidinium_carterae.1
MNNRSGGSLENDTASIALPSHSAHWASQALCDSPSSSPLRCLLQTRDYSSTSEISGALV